jgi:hypothetical protein
MQQSGTRIFLGEACLASLVACFSQLGESGGAPPHSILILLRLKLA